MPLGRLFQILFWGALALAFVMASLPHPPAIPCDPGDKVLHVLAFRVLAGLAAFAHLRQLAGGRHSGRSSGSSPWPGAAVLPLRNSTFRKADAEE
jgi:hypothetical protein